MTTITAEVIEDSTSDDSIRLSTMLLTYPRMIHAEFMTHRVFSRNASSSRAIPISRMIQAVIDDTALPHWGYNQRGMQASGDMSEEDAAIAEAIWRMARDKAVEAAQALSDLGVHKQAANRLLEPFSHIKVLVTSTFWANWFNLRNHPDADPTIKALAEVMLDALANSTPQYLRHGQWHLPFVLDHERRTYSIEDQRKLSVARCARTSYLTHDHKPPEFAADMRLFKMLMEAEPLHASPAEHQATPDRLIGMGMTDSSMWESSELHANLYGWKQFRKFFPNEAAMERV